MSFTWNLVQVYTNTMILCVTVEKHAKLKKCVRTVFDTRNLHDVVSDNNNSRVSMAGVP